MALPSILTWMNSGFALERILATLEIIHILVRICEEYMNMYQ